MRTHTRTHTTLEKYEMDRIDENKSKEKHRGENINLWGSANKHQGAYPHFFKLNWFEYLKFIHLLMPLVTKEMSNYLQNTSKCEEVGVQIWQNA